MNRLKLTLLNLSVILLIKRASCNDFYNFMKLNPDTRLSSSSYHSYQDEDIKTEDYDDLLEEESQNDYNVAHDNQNYNDAMEDNDDGAEARTFQKHSDCVIKYETVSVVKQVPSFSKHCHKVEDTKCKTIFKNSFETKMETQCVASFDTR